MKTSLQRRFTCMIISSQRLLLKWCHFSFSWASWLFTRVPGSVPLPHSWPYNTLSRITLLPEHWEIYSQREPTVPDWWLCQLCFSFMLRFFLTGKDGSLKFSLLWRPKLILRVCLIHTYLFLQKKPFKNTHSGITP